MKVTKVQIHNLASQLNLVFSDVKFKSGKTTYKYSVKNADNNLIVFGNLLLPIYETLTKMGAVLPTKPEKAPKAKKKEVVKTDSTKKNTNGIKKEWTFTESKQIVERFGMRLVVDTATFKCNVLDAQNKTVFFNVSASKCAQWCCEYLAA